MWHLCPWERAAGLHTGLLSGGRRGGWNFPLLHFRGVKPSSLKASEGPRPYAWVQLAPVILSQWLRVRMMAEVTLRQLSLADFQTKKRRRIVLWVAFFFNKRILLLVIVYNYNINSNSDFLGLGGGGRNFLWWLKIPSPSNNNEALEGNDMNSIHS